LIELLGHPEVFQVLVVGSDFNRVSHAFKVVLPLLQISDDNKHLNIMDLVVALDRIQRFRQECDGVPCIVITQLLGEDCASCDARAISFK
jgi:hypothetical protein